MLIKFTIQILKGYYCEKDSETKSFVKYRLNRKKVAYCYPDQVMNIYVDIDPVTLKMPKVEYVALNIYNCRSTTRNA